MLRSYVGSHNAALLTVFMLVMCLIPFGESALAQEDAAYRSKLLLGEYHDATLVSSDYRSASYALAELRRTDPTRAQWCLERLVPLYEQQVKEHPAVLEHRLSLADTPTEPVPAIPLGEE